MMTATTMTFAAAAAKAGECVPGFLSFMHRTVTYAGLPSHKTVYTKVTAAKTMSGSGL
jgi:hypothetical protein